MALVNGGFLLYTDMKKFLKNLVLRNRWSDFKIFSKELGFNIIRCSDHPIRAVIATGLDHLWAHQASKIFGLLSSIWVFFADTGSFWSLRSDKQMDI